MTRWRLAVLLLAFSTAPMAATTTLSPGANITAAVEAANPGDVIQLNPGTYNAVNGSPGGYTGVFAINKGVTIRGMGATPSATILMAPTAPTGDMAVQFFGYNGTRPNGATLENVQINTPASPTRGGIRIHDYQTGPARGRLSDITIRNVIIYASAPGNGFGVLLQDTDRVVLDSVTVSSYHASLNLIDASDSLIMNSTVTSAAAPDAPGLAVQGGSNNVIVGNTIGTPKAVPTSQTGYSFSGGGVVFYNTVANRFENNTLQGFRYDGLDFHSTPLGSILPAAQATRNSTDNYAGKNNVISTGVAANEAGGSAVWSNCGSHNTWLFGNDSSGSVEGGITVWSSHRNMLLGNTSRGHGSTGIFISGGLETQADCTVAAGAYWQIPVNTYLRSNAAYYNRAEQILVRTSNTNDISLNFMSPRNGRTGALMPPADATNGHSGITFQTDGRAGSSSGFRMVGNISTENQRGVWNADNKNNTGIEFYLNRILSSSLNRMNPSAALNIDAGASVGGNHWSQHAASGNPSLSTPFNGVVHNDMNEVGRVVDRYPFQSQDLGKGGTVTVYEPLAGSIAKGTRRTVRWYAPGCVYVDLTLDGSTALASDLGNTGYAVVTMPTGASEGAHNVTVHCKNSAGSVIGQGSSPGFTLTSANLQLMAPGRDDVFNAGSTIFVGWKKAPAIATVDIQISTNGGAFTNLLSGVSGTFARVTLPAGTGSPSTRIRVVSGANADTTDGVFAMRGSTTGFTNIGARTFTMGSLERLEWASPQNSRVVDISVNGTAIATGLPDRGYFDWIPANFATGAANISITFKQSDGSTTISSAASNTGTLANPASNSTGNDIPRVSGISTRMGVLTGDNVLIAGIIIGGSTPKTVVINARGPSLSSQGVSGALSNPTLTLVPASGAAPTTNNNWGEAPNAATIQSLGLAPPSALESSILTSLAPGAYTAIVSGEASAQGVGIVEVFEVDRPEVPITGISTRGAVQGGDGVMIAGFIISGNGPQTVVVRARGPSMGIAGALADPTLTIVPASGSPITNDDWGSASNAAAISASGFAPANAKESAILVTLNPGAYTAVVSGVGGTTGVAIVEVYRQ